MNNNAMMSRRPAGPVRQHSLQQPPPRRQQQQQQQQQQQIRRHRSSEDERTMQLYSSSTAASRSRFAANNKCDLYNNNNNVNNNNNNDNQVSSMMTIDRPKVRVAWGDHHNHHHHQHHHHHHHHPAKSKNDVEIVARQIPTNKSSRPTTGRGSRRCPLAEKATFLYSRQELAERLRLAWRQREENKSNIDIFLAHSTATVEERPESRLSSMTSRTVTTPKPEAKNEQVEQAVAPTRDVSEDGLIGDLEQDIALIADAFQASDRLDYQHWFSSTDSAKDEQHLAEDENKENVETSPADEQEDDDDEDEEASVVEKKSSISINCNEWNASIAMNGKADDDQVPDYSQARLKRASFQSGLNKAFNTPITEKQPSTARYANRVGTPQEPQPSHARSSFRRTNSAPPQQRRTQVNIVIDTPGMATCPIVGEPRATSANEHSAQKSRPVKSAPTAKRRSRMSKRRGALSTAAYSSKDDLDDEAVKGKTKPGKAGKASAHATMDGKVGNAGDVITMVSLISSADSESETDDNSPRDDKLISELRSKLPTTPIIKPSNGFSAGMRKPFKSVSFQQDSFDCDSPPPSRDDVRPSSSNLQARYVALSKAVTSNSDDNSPLIAAMTAWKMESVQCAPITTTTSTSTMMSLQQQQQQQQLEASTIEAPLTDREKRCLAVPIGDVLDKKRKLVRCRSAVVTTRDTNHEKHSSDASQTCLQTEMRLSQIASQITVNLQENISLKTTVTAAVPIAEINVEKTKPIASEPYCQTPKEKECWHLYKKMCDKGVFVSFDTVLRGMLTPTEYRLRQKEVSQNC